MDTEVITILQQLFALITAIISIIALYISLNNYRTKKAANLHEKYTLIKSLINEPEVNLPEILVILRGITNVDLTIEEIEWFINEPGAFVKLEEYSKLSFRYSKINLEKREFDVTELISTPLKYLFEHIKVTFFYFVFVLISSASTWLGVYRSLGHTVAGLYFTFAVGLMFFLAASSYLVYSFSMLNKAVAIKGKPVSCRR